MHDMEKALSDEVRWYDLNEIKEIRVTCNTCMESKTFEPEEHLRSDQTLPDCRSECHQFTNEERQILYGVTGGLKDAGRFDGLKHHAIAVTFHSGSRLSPAFQRVGFMPPNGPHLSR